MWTVTSLDLRRYLKVLHRVIYDNRSNCGLCHLFIGVGFQSSANVSVITNMNLSADRLWQRPEDVDKS